MDHTRHNEVLSKYLKSHKSPNKGNVTNAAERKTASTNDGGKPSTSFRQHASTSRGAKGNTASTSGIKPQNKPVGRMNRAAYLRQHMAKMNYNLGSGSANFNVMPDELLLVIFGYLGFNHLLAASRVCQRWRTLTSDNVLWKKIYMREFKPSKKKKPLIIPSYIPPGYWKSLLIKESTDRSGLVLNSLKKINPYTGLPAKSQEALETTGIGWLLCFVESENVEYYVEQYEVFYFKMSVHVRWYSVDVPALHKIKKIRIYATKPIFFDEKGKAVKESPSQKSFMFEAELKWSSWKSKVAPSGADQVVNAYIMPDGVTIFTWKDGGDLAFLTACFSFDHLVERCIRGTTTAPYFPPPHRPFRDDIDPKYGLHGYTATLELRNQRTSFWNSIYRDLYCIEGNIRDGFAKFILLDPEDSYQRSSVAKKIQLPWKTDIMKGIIQNLCYLDVTVLDDQRKAMWCVSSGVGVTSPQSTKVDYDFVGDNFSIKYSDNKGKIDMKLVWDHDEKQYYMIGLEMHLALQFINYWFGTKY